VLATLLVQNGTLRVGAILVVGKAHGRIRAMFNHLGRRVEEAGPATPVAAMGLNDVPQAGDAFRLAESDKEARTIVADRIQQQETTESRRKKAITLEQLFDQVQAGAVRELRMIVKADVQGSLEPIVSSLEDMDTGAISVNILHAETGNISENDVMLAAASNAIVVGFNVEADSAAQRLAEAEGISIRLYNIIYRLTEDIEKALKGMLEPEIRENVLGHAEVRAIFHISRVGNIAGCRVIDGEIRRNARIRVLRDGNAIYEGELASLKHHQDDVREVRQGFECGLSIKGFNEFEEGDLLESFVLEKVQVA
jgi:translation initiation factor IF-2